MWKLSKAKCKVRVVFDWTYKHVMNSPTRVLNDFLRSRLESRSSIGPRVYTFLSLIVTNCHKQFCLDTFLEFSPCYNKLSYEAKALLPSALSMSSSTIADSVKHHYVLKRALKYLSLCCLFWSVNTYGILNVNT